MEHRKQSIPLERRKERRYPLNGMACMGVLTFGYGEKIPVTVMDVSKSGLRVRIPRTLPPGMYVEILWGRTAIFGEIRHCRGVSEAQFDAGLHVEEVVVGKAKAPAEHLSVSTMSMFLTGRLTGPDRWRAAEHMKACPLCRHQILAVEDRMLDHRRFRELELLPPDVILPVPPPPVK